jgi:CheY-like chemotaxis protein
MRKIKFLVVDDDPVVLEVARERLEQLGFDVSTRDQSLGTSTWIVQHRPDFVLLDVMMPALTGGELATVIMKRSFHTGVILHSSKPESELAEIVKRTGALGAISKSVDERRFAEDVKRLTRASLSSRGNRAGGAR